jgi:hypothetical protein
LHYKDFSKMVKAILVSSHRANPAPPEYCRPTCDEDKPCGGNVCPYKGTNHKKGKEKPQKQQQRNGNRDTGKEKADGLINPSRSSDRKGKIVIKDGQKKNTPHVSKEEKINQKEKKENKENEEVIDKYLLCGVALLVIFLAFGRFGLLLLFIFYAAFKVIQG